MNLERFWDASHEERMLGFCENGDCLVCLFCGKSLEKGIIYQEDTVLYEAEKLMRRHIVKEHRSVFDGVLSLDKRITGLSTHQAALLKAFYENKSDSEIQVELGIGSASTIRNHRSAFRERERQSRVFLLLMDLLNEKVKPIRTLSGRRPDRAIVTHNEGDALMDRKKELKQLAREIKVQPGVYLVRNIKNGKVLVMSTPDLKTINGKKAQMANGSFPNPSLQADLDVFGPDAFAYEVLENLEPKEEGYFNLHDDLKRLEAKWINHFQSYGDKGYNKKP